ncbi:hypothetical protein ACLHZU_08860, partial [Aeromonas salmonicida]|uniref:hypothetical protein n=1 Tax=Aeromonas salmonicida TaxID=645 RepID=UPI003CFD7B9A
QHVAAGVEFYSTAFSSQALFSKAFRGTDRLDCVAACPVDVAHYREIDRVGKGHNAIKLQKSALF